MKEKYNFLMTAALKLNELGFHGVYLDDNDFFAVYYNDEIKTLCSIETYHGKILCYLDSPYLNQSLFIQDINLLSGIVFMLRKGAFPRNNNKLPISRAHIVSEKEIDETVAKKRYISIENFDFLETASDTDVESWLLLKREWFDESEDNLIEKLKVSRLEQMPYEVKSMIDCNISYYQKKGNSFVNRI